MVYIVIIYFTLEQSIFSLWDSLLAFPRKGRPHPTQVAQRHAFCILSCHSQLWKISVQVYTDHYPIRFGFFLNPGVDKKRTFLIT